MPLVRPIVLAGLFAAAASPVFAQTPPAPSVPAVPALQASGSGSVILPLVPRHVPARVPVQALARARGSRSPHDPGVATY